MFLLGAQGRPEGLDEDFWGRLALLGRGDPNLFAGASFDFGVGSLEPLGFRTIGGLKLVTLCLTFEEESPRLLLRLCLPLKAPKFEFLDLYISRTYCSSSPFARAF